MSNDSDVVGRVPSHGGRKAPRQGTRPTAAEWILLALLVAVGAWLRFSRLDLLEFQGDEAFATQLALDFLKSGRLPQAGLMSSVGVTNPPLFSYLLIPMFAISQNPVVVSCGIGILGLAAVVMTWHTGRKYYGPVTGLVAAAFFAVSPWAVIYSRKIWAQDFVPVFATATMWAVHAVALGNKPKAAFWCVLLPLCVVQIHFSGLALTAAVIVILAWLRPRIDWRFAALGLAVAAIPMLPYLRLQSRTGWADFKRAKSTLGSGQRWEQLQGVTVEPVSGYRQPSRRYLSYALDIMNGGRIEDVLGISAASGFDRERVYANKGGGRRYFSESLTLGDWLLVLQRLAFVGALLWIAVRAVRAVKRWRVSGASSHAAWILLLWVAVPVAVFWMAGLWVYLTYFVILYPVHFLVCGLAAQELAGKLRGLITAAVLVLVAGNIVFMIDYYRFVSQNGGAQGTAGSGLGYKQAVARFLAEKGGRVLRAECEAELQLAMVRNQMEGMYAAGDLHSAVGWRLAMAHSQEELNKLMQTLAHPILVELNHDGQPELPQLEWPLLITQAGGNGAPEAALLISTNRLVLLVDGNREALQPQQRQQLAQFPSTNFGPIRLHFASR